jgi:O-antigen/teichoic acid export membrane protein
MQKQSIFNSIFRVFSSNVTAIGITALIGIMLPRLLGPQLLGKLNSALALAAIVYSISFLGIRSSIVIVMGQKSYDMKQMVSAIFFISLLSILLSTSMLLFFLLFISKDIYALSMIILVCLLNPFDFVLSYMSGFSLANQKFKIFNRLNLLPKVIQLIAVLVLFGYFDLRLTAVLFAILISKLLTILITFRSINLPWPDLRIRHIPAALFKSLLKYGMVYALAFLLTRLNYRVDLLILKRLSEISEVGYYSLGVNIAETIWQIPIAVGLVLMTHSAGEKDQKLITAQVCSTLRISLILSILATTVLFLLTPFLIKLVFGVMYLPSISIVRTILPGILFFVVLKIINSQFIGNGKPEMAIYALLPSVIINVVLNILLIPSYKGVGAAMATNISYFCGSFVLLVIYSRTYSVSLVDIFKYRSSDFSFIHTLRHKLVRHFS